MQLTQQQLQVIEKYNSNPKVLDMHKLVKKDDTYTFENIEFDTEHKTLEELWNVLNDEIDYGYRTYVEHSKEIVSIYAMEVLYFELRYGKDIRND